MATIRFETEQEQWAEREARISRKFGAEWVKEGPFLKEKLAYLEGMEIRYGKGANVDERIELAILKQKRRDIEKALYPGLFPRILYRLMQSFIIYRERASTRIAIERNYDAVKSALNLKGLGAAVKEFEQQARLGKQEFIIPVSYNVSEKEMMSFKINMQKDFNGDYQIKEAIAVLKIEGRPKEGGTLKLDHAVQNLSADHAYRLLAGKSVKSGDNWHSLDFNDRDAMGNCKLMSFPKEYGFDLDKLLREIEAKEAQDPAERLKVTAALENGKTVRLTSVGNNGGLEIEANPRQLSVFSAQYLNEKNKERESKVSSKVEIKQQQAARSKMKIV